MRRLLVYFSVHRFYVKPVRQILVRLDVCVKGLMLTIPISSVLFSFTLLVSSAALFFIFRVLGKGRSVF